MICGIGEVPDEIQNEPGRVFLSPSRLMTLNQSPAHYEWTYILGNRKVTPAMQLGTWIHEAILEPEKWSERLVMPDFPRKSKEQPLTIAAQKEEWMMLYGDRSITEDNRDKVNLIQSQFYKNPTMKAIFEEDGYSELQLYWEHKSGVIFRMRLDKVLLSGYCLDLKTTQSGSKKTFSSTIYKNGLHIQAAIYFDALTAIANKGLIEGLKGIESFMFATIETTEPYLSTAYAPDFGTIEAGRTCYEKLIQTYLDCTEANLWPGYSNRIEQISLPNWAWYELEEHEPTE